MAKLIYGKNPIITALMEKKVVKIYLKEGFADEKIIKLSRTNLLKPYFVSNKELNRLVGDVNHQGVVALIQDFSYSSLDEIIAKSKKSEHPLVLVLDEIKDPQNFGAIIRSANAFSVDGIIIKDHNQVEVNSTVYKISTGAIEHVKIAKVSNISNALKSLKKEGFWVYSSALENAKDYNTIDYSGPVCLIVGNEGSGISRLVKENSDFIIKIPMSGNIDSLNVSVATGILLSRVRNK